MTSPPPNKKTIAKLPYNVALGLLVVVLAHLHDVGDGVLGARGPEVAVRDP